jgi:hypothetical protein
MNTLYINNTIYPSVMQVSICQLAGLTFTELTCYWSTKYRTENIKIFWNRIVRKAVWKGGQ